MIPLNFYRDDDYVYYNNPSGITKKMTIAEFESMMSNESELPEYSSSSQGKVLSVDSDGDLEWASLPPDELPEYSSSNEGEVLSVDSNGDLDWASLPASELPSYSSSNEGESLSVDSNGDLEWTSLIFPIHTTQTGALDKTWNEIKNAALSGKSCVFVDDHDQANITLNPIYCIFIDADSGAYKVICAYWIDGNSFGSAVFSSATADGYPQPYYGE